MTRGGRSLLDSLLRLPERAAGGIAGLCAAASGLAGALVLVRQGQPGASGSPAPWVFLCAVSTLMALCLLPGLGWLRWPLVAALIGEALVAALLVSVCWLVPQVVWQNRGQPVTLVPVAGFLAFVAGLLGHWLLGVVCVGIAGSRAMTDQQR